MRFRLQQRFQAPLATVEAAFVDPALLAHLADLPELGHPELLELVADGDAVRQRVRYRFTGVLSPSMAAVVERDRLTWVEESELDFATHRTWFRIVPDHYRRDRFRCSGTVDLIEDEGETLRQADIDLDVRLRFVGQSLTRAIIQGLADNAAVQESVVSGWLSMRSEQSTGPMSDVPDA